MDNRDGAQDRAYRRLSPDKALRGALFVMVCLWGASHTSARADDSSLKDSLESTSTISGSEYIEDKCATNYCYQTVCFAAALQVAPPIKIGRKSLAQFSTYNDETKYGCAKVSLPRQKQRGQFPFKPPANEKGFDVARREKEIVIDQIDVLPKKTFQYALKAAMVSPRSNIPLFVHGYNTDFNYAVARAAQIAYDSGNSGPILLFAWPAAAKASLFLEAMDNVSGMEPLLIDFLDFLAQQDVTQKINIIAHSLGAKLVLDSLSKSNGSFFKSIGQIILGAPLVTPTRLKKAATDLGSRVDRITIFCSTDDRPIWLANTSFSEPIVALCSGSEELSLYSIDNRTVDYNRAIDYRQRVRIDVIDITDSVDCGTLGFSCTHSRYASNASILQDIAYLLISLSS